MRSFRRIALACLATGVTLASVVGGLAVVRVARLARPHEARAVTDVAAHDVAIVPGASVSRGRPNRHLANRLESARQLYERGLVRRVLVSGNEQAGEVSAMSRWLVERGVPEADILRDPDGVRTLETMRNAAGRFTIASAVVCTQAQFLDRTVYLAREAGIDAAGVAAAATRLRPSSRAVEAAKTVLAFLEADVLGRLDRAPAPVAVVAEVR
jgi:vancomycin permeability regulator SanA